MGDVEIGEDSSVWYNTVIRGDVNGVTGIGSRTNIQDLTIIHVEKGAHATRLGDDVTVGHHVVVHGCTIGNRVLVGIGAIVLNGVVIEDDVFIAAGTLLIPGTHVPRADGDGQSRQGEARAHRGRAGQSGPHAAGYVLNAKLHRSG